jgi:hypothetical protein
MAESLKQKQGKSLRRLTLFGTLVLDRCSPKLGLLGVLSRKLCSKPEGKLMPPV